MQIEAILETCLYVDDLKAAADFYSRLLEVEPFSQVENRHVFFQVGKSKLLLFNPAETSTSTTAVPAHGAYGPGHIAFAIDPATVGAWQKRLAQLNIPIESEITWPSGGQSLYFRDPAGNSLELATSQLWTG